MQDFFHSFFYSLNEFRSRIRGNDPVHEPKTKLVIVENTHNMCGGRVIPLDWMDELAAICKKRKIKMHMDGARVFHAAEYLDVPVSRIARDFDSVVFNLCKSLSAPVGSVLIGSNDFIKRARRTRMALGGGMSKVGVVAAAGLVALEDIVPKLGGDHRHTRQIAKAIYDLQSPYVTVDIDVVETNIGLIHFLQPKKYPAKYFVQRLQEINNKEIAAGIVDKYGNGIIVNVFAKDERNSIRYVLYHHINDEITDLIIKKIVYCINELE